MFLAKVDCPTAVVGLISGSVLATTGFILGSVWSIALGIPAIALSILDVASTRSKRQHTSSPSSAAQELTSRL